MQGDTNGGEELQVQELPGKSASPATTIERQDSGDSSAGNDTQDEVDQQLRRGLDESTTPPRSGIEDRISEPPQTPPPLPKRESGSSLKVKVPGAFWNGQVNVLH
jgi:hypothetical protein